MNSDGSKLAARIKARLEALGKSASAASLEAGLGRSAVTAILTGGSESPRLVTLQKLTGPLECSLEYLVGFASEPARKGFRVSPEVEEFRPLMGLYLHHLEADVFRARPSFSEVKDSRSLIYRGDAYKQHRVVGHILLDDSMMGVGILRGDVVTATSDIHDEEIELRDGVFAVCRRHIASTDLYEDSLRRVRIDGGRIHFETCEIAGVNRQEYSPISARLPEITPTPESMIEFDVSEGVKVYVKGIALRVTRRLIGSEDPRVD